MVRVWSYRVTVGIFSIKVRVKVWVRAWSYGVGLVLWLRLGYEIELVLGFTVKVSVMLRLGFIVVINIIIIFILTHKTCTEK